MSEEGITLLEGRFEIVRMMMMLMEQQLISTLVMELERTMRMWI
jgi:hypothetical protein